MKQFNHSKFNLISIIKRYITTTTYTINVIETCVVEQPWKISQKEYKFVVIRVKKRTIT